MKTLNGMIATPAARLRRHMRRIAKENSGIAAVEFSLILPILILLWIGGVEVTSALSVDRRLNNLAASLGDMTARSPGTETNASIDAMFGIATRAMYPTLPPKFPAVGMRITAVKMDAAGNATVAWTRSKNTVPAMGAINTIVPATLKVPSSQLIMSEVYYTYTPAVGYVITSAIALTDRMYFVPRLVAAIKLCANAGDTNCPS